MAQVRRHRRRRARGHGARPAIDRRPLRPGEVPAADQRAHRRRGARRTVATHDTYASMGLSRGASALGVALALGEVSRA